MEKFLILAPLALYFLAIGLYLTRLLWEKSLISVVALRVVIAALFLQLLQFVYQLVFLAEPWPATYFDFFQLSGALVALVFVGLCFYKKFYAAAPFFVLCINILMLISVTYHHPSPLIGHSPGYFFIHMASIFLTLVAFAVALIAAALFLISEQKLKNKEFSGWMAKLPPLPILEDLYQKSLKVAFILLTLVIVTGAGYAKITQGHYLMFELKQLGALGVWFYFALLQALRWRLRLVGHRGILWGMAGLVAVFGVFIIGF
jgi:ABC-type uncharacterized transport system permease subunit